MTQQSRPESGTEITETIEDYMVNLIYNHVFNTCPEYFWHKKIQNNAKRFIKELYLWICNITNMSYSERKKRSETYKCFFYYTYRKKLIPIPEALFIRWYGKGQTNSRGAYRLMELLKIAGIIQREVKPYHDYSGRSNAGRCSYYAVKLPQII